MEVWGLTPTYGTSLIKLSSILIRFRYVKYVCYVLYMLWLKKTIWMISSCLQEFFLLLLGYRMRKVLGIQWRVWLSNGEMLQLPHKEIYVIDDIKKKKSLLFWVLPIMNVQFDVFIFISRLSPFEFSLSGIFRKLVNTLSIASKLYYILHDPQH